jgi:hypothetical protein
LPDCCAAANDQSARSMAHTAQAKTFDRMNFPRN